MRLTATGLAGEMSGEVQGTKLERQVPAIPTAREVSPAPLLCSLLSHTPAVLRCAGAPALPEVRDFAGNLSLILASCFLPWGTPRVAEFQATSH